jgi:23S rRNA (adenine1618-N6)-methyltransferase
VEAAPDLQTHLVRTPDGRTSIDFADPGAVKALNRALLLHHYAIRDWDLPEGYLCPPVPGRADYVHHLADLLGESAGSAPPKGPSIRILDLGTGASGIYVLLGQRSYGWSFAATDVDPGAQASLRRILAANPDLAERVEPRRQPRPDCILQGVLRPGERFHACLCNPPFHASALEARERGARKVRNLRGTAAADPVRNFGGRGGELWCPGGEAAFVGRLIEESREFGNRVLWFTSLVSRSENLPGLKRKLRALQPAEIRVVPMAQGQKRSRFLAWTYVPAAERRAWFAA